MARFMFVVSLLALAVFGAHAAPASAAPNVLRLGCAEQAMSQEFSRWGDNHWYKAVPNGGLEQGSQGWALGYGARVVPGNEPFGLGGGGSYSLSLGSGASATTPASCVKLTDTNARFMVIETGAASGTLKVELQYRGLLGMWTTVRMPSIDGTSTWEPSPAYGFFLEGALGSITSLNVTTTDVRLRLTASGYGAGFVIDAAFVDPWRFDD